MAERHSCAACGQSFSSKGEADDHAQKVHGDGAKKDGGEATDPRRVQPRQRPPLSGGR